MKRIFTLLSLCLLVAVTQAQTDGRYVLGAQVDATSSQSQHVEGAILFGVQSTGYKDVKKEGLIGVVTKQYTTPVGHNQFYYGARMYGSAQIYKYLSFYVQAEFLRGEYYLESNLTNDIEVKTRMLPRFNMGVGLPITKASTFLVGYCPYEYNPVRYLKTGITPHGGGAFSFKFNFVLPISKTFQMRGFDN